jgi:replication factor A1
LRRKKGAGEYLAFLTVKYDIHPDILFCALLSAGEIGKATCGPLSVECRGKIDDKIYYLIRDGSEVVAQFPISEELLARQRNPIRNYMETDMVQSYKPLESEKPFYTSIEDLKIGKRNINLKAEVVEVSEPKIVSTQYGNRISLAKALLKDETGEIKLCLWREQVDAVTPGDKIELENASVTRFRGKKQLTLGNKGTIKILQNTEAEPDSLLSGAAEVPK